MVNLFCTNYARFLCFSDGDQNGICPAGYYCPEGTGGPNRCPSGTYNEGTMKENEEDCLPCPPGQYCEQDGYGLNTLLLAMDCMAG